MPYKLLIASASAGAGHMRAAAALQSSFQAAGHDGTAQVVDVLPLMSAAFRSVYVRSYYSVIGNIPSCWRFFYNRWDRKSYDGLQRRTVCFFDRINARRFMRFVRKEQFTHVLCTHFLPAEILSWMRRTGRLDAPAGVVVTDYDAHRIWINEGTDLYFVASDDLRDLLAEKGAPAGQVVSAGIPVDPVFAEPVDKAAARKELGLDPVLPTVLVVAGTGPGGMAKTAAAAAECGPVQILAVARRDEKLKKALEEMPLPPGARLVAYGFVDFMHKLMAASDLIVTKPGGMSSTESLAMGLPMVLGVPIPGQEEKNSAFLVGCGAACSAKEPEDVRRVVGELLSDRAVLDQMSRAARAAARPRAGFDIIDAVLRLPAEQFKPSEHSNTI